MPIRRIFQTLDDRRADGPTGDHGSREFLTSTAMIPLAAVSHATPYLSPRRDSGRLRATGTRPAPAAVLLNPGKTLLSSHLLDVLARVQCLF